MTDKNREIEEMALTEVDILANDLNQHCADLAENYCGGTTCLACLAHALTAKGYRKQSEGEWVRESTNNTRTCSICGEAVTFRSKFCPNCGAKMKGGE